MQQNLTSEFGCKAERILLKLQDIAISSESKQSEKYRQKLQKIMEIQSSLEDSQLARKKTYEKFIQKIVYAQKQVQIEKQRAEKKMLLIHNKIESVNKKYDNLLQKLRKERIQRQWQLQNLIQQKLSWLINKNQINMDKSVKKNCRPENIESQMASLQQIKKQIQQFFSSAQVEQASFRNQLFKSFSQYRQYLQKQSCRNSQQETINYLKQIHQEVSVRILIMKQKRENMEQEVLKLLEAIVNTLGRSKGKQNEDYPNQNTFII